MKKRFLSIIVIILIVFTSACSKKDEKAIILQMPGLESEKYTKNEFYDFLKENEEPILEFIDNINYNFNFKDNDLYLKNKKVAILTIIMQKGNKLERTFYYCNKKASSNDDLIVTVMLNDDSMKSKIIEESVRSIKENKKNIKAYVYAGLKVKNEDLYYNGKLVNSIIEENPKGEYNIYYFSSDGVNLKASTNEDGNLLDIEEIE